MREILIAAAEWSNRLAAIKISHIDQVIYYPDYPDK
jgi:hypothetical protein